MCVKKPASVIGGGGASVRTEWVVGDCVYREKRPDCAGDGESGHPAYRVGDARGGSEKTCLSSA